MVTNNKQIPVGWAINVDKDTGEKEKIYPLTHIKAVVAEDGKRLGDIIVTDGYELDNGEPFIDPFLQSYLESSIQLSNINIDTYDYKPFKKYNTDSTCTGGAISTITEYFITVYPVGNILIAKFLDTEGREFTKKKIDGVWEENYSSLIY